MKLGALKYTAPILSIAVLTLIAVLPWGLPSENRFFLPLMPIIAIHYWGLRRPESVPEWSVFLAGLTLDVLTQGPLGYWALIYLLGYLLGALCEPYGRHSQRLRVALFAAALMCVTAAAWLLSSAYFWELAEWRPYVSGAGYAAIAALVIVPLLHWLSTANDTRDNARFARGV